MVHCMDKITKYFRGCLGQNEGSEGGNGEDGRPRQRDGGEAPANDNTESDDSENPPVIEITKVYSAFIAEANRLWENDVNSAVLRGRSDDSSLGSLSLGDGCLPERPATVGGQIVCYSASMVDIHKFFLKLDPKRFQPQANDSEACSSTGTMKTVQESRTRTRRQGNQNSEEPVIQRDVFLIEPEKSLYKRVLQCAHFPVLSSPSSEPSVTPSSSQGTRGSSSGSEADFILSPTDKVSIEHDMLMACLQEAFGVTQKIHDRYYNEVKQSIPNRDPSKLLLRELQDRFYQLETNQHNYYRIGSFLSREGYSKWRIKQLEATKRLIRRFWKRDIPGYLGMQVSGINAQNEYKTLQEKLFKYEMKMRVDTDERATVSVFPVSSAAKKLLKEFGLRYGVCSLFRQISSLMCMAKNFEYHGWYIKCCTQAVFEIKSLLESQYELIVENEHEMLLKALNLLQERVEYTLKNTKLLCPKNLPFDTVSWILEIIKAIMRIKKDLGIWDETQPSEEELICGLIKKAIEVGYKKIKGTILIDTEIETPKMLRCLIDDIRSELEFYKEFKRKCPDVSCYMDIDSVSTKKLYSLLMNDVRAVCIQRMEPGREETSIDVEMLRLAYLLAKLDKDWAFYIAPSFQKWRIYFMNVVKNTTAATRLSILKLIRNFIRRDQWTTIEFEQNDTLDETNRPESRPCAQSLNSFSTFVSVSSLVPSETSAFNKVNTRTSAGSGSAFESKGGSYANEVNSGPTSSRKRKEIADESSVGKAAKGDTVGGVVNDALQSSGICEVGEQVVYEKDFAVERTMTGDVLGRIERENSIEEDKSSSSVYETPPSSNMDDDEVTSVKSLFQSSNSFRSFSDASRSLRSFQDTSDFQNGVSGMKSGNSADLGSFVSDILDEIITNITHSEDEMIDMFVNSILKKAVYSIKEESIGLRLDEEITTAILPGPSFIDKIQNSERHAIVSPKPHKMLKSDKNNGGASCDGLTMPQNGFSFKDQAFKPIIFDENAAETMKTKPRNFERTFSFTATNPELIRERTGVECRPRIKSDTVLPEWSDESRGNEANNQEAKEHSSTGFSSQLANELGPPPIDNGSSQSSDSRSTSTLLGLNIELPKNGKVLVSSSLIDVLITIQRLSGFFSELHKLLIPTSFHPVFSNDFQALKREHETFEGHLFKGLTTSIKETLITYADGILALDICGWDDDDLSAFMNSEIIQRLRERQRTGLISGCRHDLNRRMSVNAYDKGLAIEYCPQVLKVLKYCIGEWEAISAEICTRLNNVTSLIDVMDSIETRAKKVCGIHPSVDDVHSSNRSIINTALQIGCSELKICRENLEVIWKSQVSILAKRITVMLEKIIELLLSLTLKWTEKEPYKKQMKPVSLFLEHQMAILREYLYPTCLKAVVKELWQCVLNILHKYADNLRLNKTNPKYNAERFIQLMSICLRHLVVDDDTGDKLTALCRPVLLRFQLYSYRPEQLKLILDLSKSMESEDHVFLKTITMKEVLLDMRSTGALKRVFTGAEFVEALLANNLWIQQFGVDESQNDFENAIAIGEMLLEREMIKCIERPRSSDENAVRYFSPSTPCRGSLHSVIHIGGHGFILDPDDNGDEVDANDSIIESSTDSSTDSFQNLANHVYKINVASCNVSDLSIKISRVLRQVDRRFSKVIQNDVISILEYRSHWMKQTDYLNILNIISPRNFRPKAFSWPCP